MQVPIRQFQTEQAFAVDVQCVTLTHRHIFGIAEAPHANCHGGGSLQSPTQVLSMTVGEEASHWKSPYSHDVELENLLDVLPVVLIVCHAVVVLL